MPTTHILTCYAEDCPKGRYKGSVLAWERPHTTPGVYAFLGLATLPRFRTQANLLRLLPSVIVQRIARFAHRDTYLASWSAGETPTRRPTVVDVADLLNASELISGGELGTHLRIKSLGDDSWTWCDEPVVFGVLIDMVRGCVTFRLNGIDGPCVRFPNVDWRLGVHFCLSHIPIEPEHDPMQIVVSCATPPVPPSLFEAAANPLTGAEHVAADSMEYDADVYDSGGEYDFESDDEGESNDEDESDDHHIFFHSANVYT